MIYNKLKKLEFTLNKNNIYEENPSNEIMAMLTILPEDYRLFLEKFKYNISFKKDVIFKPLTPIPIMDKKGYVSLGVLYGIKNNEAGIIAQNAIFHNQIPDNYIVIGEGNPGDQICINTENKSIYYYWHEATYEDETMYLISSCFSSFIELLEVDISPPTKSVSDKVTSFRLDF